MSWFRKTRVTGLMLASLCLVVLGCGRETTRTYYTTIRQPLPAIEVGAAVREGGIAKGSVRQVVIEDGPMLRVDMELAEDVVVTRSTRARIGVSEPFGPFFIELTDTGTSEDRLPSGALIQSVSR